MFYYQALRRIQVFLSKESKVGFRIVKIFQYKLDNNCELKGSRRYKTELRGMRVVFS